MLQNFFLLLSIIYSGLYVFNDYLLLLYLYKLTFELGLTHYDLADLGLTTLEKWDTQSTIHNTINSNSNTTTNTNAACDDMKELLYEVLPCLDDYLRSEVNENRGNITFSSCFLLQNICSSFLPDDMKEFAVQTFFFFFLNCKNAYKWVLKSVVSPLNKNP